MTTPKKKQQKAISKTSNKGHPTRIKAQTSIPLLVKSTPASFLLRLTKQLSVDEWLEIQLQHRSLRRTWTENRRFHGPLTERLVEIDELKGGTAYMVTVRCGKYGCAWLLFGYALAYLTDRRALIFLQATSRVR